MQIGDVVKTLDQMTNEELLARLRDIRHNRQVVKAAVAKRTERVKKKESRAASGKIEDLVEKMSPEDIAKLIKQLGG